MPARLNESAVAGSGAGSAQSLRHVHRENGQDVILGFDDVSWRQSLPIADNALKIALRSALTGTVPVCGPDIDGPTAPRRSMDDGPGRESLDLPSEQVKATHSGVLRVEDDVEGRCRLKKAPFEAFVSNPDRFLVAVVLAAQEIHLATFDPADLSGLHREPPPAFPGKPDNDLFGQIFRDIAGGRKLLPRLDFHSLSSADDIELTAAFEATGPDQGIVRRVEHLDRERYGFAAEFALQRRHSCGVRASEARRQRKLGQGAFLLLVRAHGLNEPIHVVQGDAWIVRIK